MIASSMRDPMLGIDIHWELIPPAMVPTPLPNPFVGIVFDPMGLAAGLAIGGMMSAVTGAPFKGPVVYWGAFPATNTGTEGKFYAKVRRTALCKAAASRTVRAVRED